jgi:segregation and condensation protein B
VIYATTPAFLAHFGLESRRDLPGIDELRAAGLLDPVEDALEALQDAGAATIETATGLSHDEARARDEASEAADGVATDEESA